MINASSFSHFFFLRQLHAYYRFFFFFFFNDTATTEIYTLSLHDALPISRPPISMPRPGGRSRSSPSVERIGDRKSNTSELQSRLHLVCRLLLEKKKKMRTHSPDIQDAYERIVVSNTHTTLDCGMSSEYTL